MFKISNKYIVSHQNQKKEKETIRVNEKTHIQVFVLSQQLDHFKNQSLILSFPVLVYLYSNKYLQNNDLKHNKQSVNVATVIIKYINVITVTVMK